MSTCWLPTAAGRPQVSDALQHVHCEMGQHYNIAKKRGGLIQAKKRCGEFPFTGN
jgi:hypothetical protein